MIHLLRAKHGELRLFRRRIRLRGISQDDVWHLPPCPGRVNSRFVWWNQLKARIDE